MIRMNKQNVFFLLQSLPLWDHTRLMLVIQKTTGLNLFSVILVNSNGLINIQERRKTREDY